MIIMPEHSNFCFNADKPEKSSQTFILSAQTLILTDNKTVSSTSFMLFWSPAKILTMSYFLPAISCQMLSFSLLETDWVSPPPR